MVENLEQSFARLLLQLQAVFLEGVVLTGRIFKNGLHEESVIVRRAHLLHRDFEHGFRRFLLVVWAIQIYIKS